MTIVLLTIPFLAVGDRRGPLRLASMVADPGRRMVVFSMPFIGSDFISHRCQVLQGSPKLLPWDLATRRPPRPRHCDFFLWLCVGISGWRRVTITLPVGKRIILLDLWNEFSCSSQILGISIDDPCLILRLYLFIWASTLWATLLMIAHWKARTCFLTPTPILQAIAPLPYYFEKLTSPYPLAISHCYLKGLLLLCGNSSFTALFFYNMDPELLSVMENLQFIEEKSTVVVTETNIVDKDTAQKVTPALNDAAIVFVIEPTTVTATVEATNCTQQSTLAANEGTQDNMVSVLTVIFGVYAAEGSS
ncbi:hypothetical protein V6N11_053672 [Hibiscus sabdariffa]|uniref:Uncharacterized protein n=1 Tax=Hibiscus sabdariffa TaxID=183260 RepID=A0ABR2NED8_9ROSI